ncbi:addiction module protein [Methylobacillus sp.]|uniref:addiction module protein n=1 Tax=Methylobacillus sp. TaxID=56818 RepID=UPI002FDFF09F
MASMALEQLRSEALGLAEKERAELAHDILASLDGPPDIGVEQAWAMEIEQRIAEIDSGTVSLFDADDVVERILHRIRQL